MSRRLERVNQLLREEISRLVTNVMKDPRLAAVLTITQVKVSVDLRHAQVFASVLGTQAEKEQTLKGLQSAAGFLRRELHHTLSLRPVPELSFVLDDSMERAGHVLDIMNQLSAERPTGNA